jgi:hypothetical protein
MWGDLTLELGLWVFGSPGRLQLPTFGSVGFTLTLIPKWGCDIPTFGSVGFALTLIPKWGCDSVQFSCYKLFNIHEPYDNLIAATCEGLLGHLHTTNLVERFVCTLWSGWLYYVIFLTTLYDIIFLWWSYICNNDQMSLLNFNLKLPFFHPCKTRVLCKWNSIIFLKGEFHIIRNSIYILFFFQGLPSMLMLLS